MHRAVQTSAEDRQRQQHTALPQGSLISTALFGTRPGPLLHQDPSTARLLGQAAGHGGSEGLPITEQHV